MLSSLINRFYKSFGIPSGELLYLLDSRQRKLRTTTGVVGYENIFSYPTTPVVVRNFLCLLSNKVY